MNKVLLGILREVGIALVILIVLAAVTVFAFKDQLPYDETIPEGEEYVTVSKGKYSVSSTDRLSEINSITITHEANQGQIIDAENEVRIQTGKYTPFGSIDSTTDIPTERVGVSIAPSEADNKSSANTEDDDDNTNNTTNTNNTETSQGKMNYPISDDTKDVISGNTETSEQAAQRRMANVE